MCIRDSKEVPEDYTLSLDNENDFIFLGLISMMDPPREESKAVSYTHLDVYKRQLRYWIGLHPACSLKTLENELRLVYPTACPIISTE